MEFVNADSNDDVLRLAKIYDRFNARDMDAVLASLHPDVIWANGMEGGYVRGREGVRDYWTRQWGVLDPRVEPVAFSHADNGAWVVEVHQVVHDCEGRLLVDQMVGHIFHLDDGLIVHFDIRRETAVS
jgi:nuclear transport factor 2 (NTF2) superfamily protein